MLLNVLLLSNVCALAVVVVFVFGIQQPSWSQIIFFLFADVGALAVVVVIVCSSRYYASAWLPQPLGARRCGRSGINSGADDSLMTTVHIFVSFCRNLVASTLGFFILC